MSSSGPVLFVTPNWRWDTTPLSTDTLHPPPGAPLEFAYVAAGLDGGEVLVDAYADDLSIDALAEVVHAVDPGMIIISTVPSLLYWRCPPMTVEAVSAAVSACRTACRADTVLIGPHATFTPDWALDRTGASACWRGSPECELSHWIMTGASAEHVHTRDHDGRIRVEPAHAIPVARMSVLPLARRYPPHMWCVTEGERAAATRRRSGALAEASRGCPWQCVYCAKAPLRDAFSRRDLAVLQAEWAQLEELGVDYVFFIDETFNLGGPRLTALLDALERSSLTFGFQGRPELMTADQAERLAGAGCVYAELGVDVNAASLSQRIGRRQKPDDARAGIERCRAAIPIVRFNRLNLSTVDYRVRLGLDGADGWDYPPDPAYPYPGAPLGAMVMQLYGRAEFDWDFALRYSWWLRMEVELQRGEPDVGDAEMAERQQRFLALDVADARALAEALDRSRDDEAFRVANKYVVLT